MSGAAGAKKGCWRAEATPRKLACAGLCYRRPALHQGQVLPRGRGASRASIQECMLVLWRRQRFQRATIGGMCCSVALQFAWKLIQSCYQSSMLSKFNGPQYDGFVWLVHSLARASHSVRLALGSLQVRGGVGGVPFDSAGRAWRLTSLLLLGAILLGVSKACNAFGSLPSLQSPRMSTVGSNRCRLPRARSATPTRNCAAAPAPPRLPHRPGVYSVYPLCQTLDRPPSAQSNKRWRASRAAGPSWCPAPAGSTPSAPAPPSGALHAELPQRKSEGAQTGDAEPAPPRSLAGRRARAAPARALAQPGASSR